MNIGGGGEGEGDETVSFIVIPTECIPCFLIFSCYHFDSKKHKMEPGKREENGVRVGR